MPETQQQQNIDVLSLVEKHHNDPEAILEIFKDAQIISGALTPGLISDVARALNIPTERANGIATFYSMLTVSKQETKQEITHRIHICDGPVCWMNGAPTVMKNIIRMMNGDSKWVVERSSCLGLCDRAPALLIDNRQVGPFHPEEFQELLRSEPDDKKCKQSPGYEESRPGELRVMMANAGRINPDSIDSAMENGAYQSLKLALSRSPDEVLNEVEKSGLTGRGGAGFLVGRKWRFVSQAKRFPKYIICNADESEPLIFKDRVLIDTNPHQILEGMAIAGYATGASEAFVYIRGEYKHQAERLENAIAQAEKKGFLGDNILGSNTSFHIHLHRGAGAYICGEETALIESLEGKRGEPRLRPPYPPEYGYRGYPSLVNNVESFAAVPSIVINGADWYHSLSTYPTPGTKIYMVLGHVNHPGLFEAPFGLTLRQVIDQFGGGMRPGSIFKFALTGGAAGTIASPDLLDIPIDYTSISKGVSLGAGAFLICDQSVSTVALLRELLHFFSVESCGQCTPCRVGTHRSYEILNGIVNGGKYKEGNAELRSLADVLFSASLCGLGQSVSIPVLSALEHFQEEFS